MSLPVVRLKGKRDKRVKAGHPWVFSNEIDGIVKELPPGGAVEVYDSKGKHLGRGLANPKSLIAVRMTSRVKDDLDHAAFYAMRLRAALAFRSTAATERTALRVVSSEGDFLPGFTLDKFGDYMIAQITTLGMEQRKELLQAAIVDVFAPKGVILRSNARLRTLEGLEPDDCLWFGEVPDHINFEESGATFTIDPMAGPASTHFFDRTDHRLRAAKLCAGGSVLDVYAGAGTFGITAQKMGATSVTAIERSSDNCAMIAHNAAQNGFEEPSIYHGDSKKVMNALVVEGERFDAVFVDPPAFAQNKAKAGSALRGYEEMNAVAMSVVKPGGLFFTSTCSVHVHNDRFFEMLNTAAAVAGVQLQQLWRTGASSDHPGLLAMPETRYLRCVAFRVTL